MAGGNSLVSLRIVAGRTSSQRIGGQEESS